MYVAAGDPIETRAEKLEEVEAPTVGKLDRFLKGPVPWNWLVRASKLPGTALILGLCLWRLKGATRSNSVWLGNSELQPFGIDRAAKSRGLAALEKAGLIAINRNAARRPIVTILT
jgi:hypothetical protein